MLFSVWTWVPVVIIVFVIFYANKLPEMRKQAEEKFKEGKVLFEKKKVELTQKATQVAEKAKEKQKKMAEERAAKEEKAKVIELDGEEAEITEDDLAFMPTDKKEEEKKEDK